jgi:hypothetical protein
MTEPLSTYRDFFRDFGNIGLGISAMFCEKLRENI